MQVVGRFAPSPSGRMHLGNIFSAMLAWLSVRSRDGKMILRLEDLDPDRCRQEYCEQVKKDLAWLGLDWDEEQIPQSRRTDAYREQFEKLEAIGIVYPCYCSRAELHAASAPHASDGTVLYAGTCRNLTRAERETMTRKPAWRIQVPNEIVSFTDGLQGVYRENLAEKCGDFILRRSDGVYAYQLAVVTDDAAGGVNEVVRGCDLLSSSPRQMYLQELLGISAVQYYHVPLLLAPDGRRLSKRERDLDMGALQERFTAEQMIGHLAQLAGLQDKPEAIRAKELAQIFSWEKVKKENISITSALFLGK